jgi:sterol desaturase/sphingolipid hydroxylase (fatty acid hydroxylase superfamily)
MPGIAFRPYAFIGTVITTAWATIIFINLSSFFNYNNINTLYLVFIAQTLVLTIIHSAYLREIRGFNKIMRSLYLVSPEDHLLHHSYNTGFINYGNVSILWDILFKTYKKYSNKEIYLVGTTDGRDYVDSITFGLFNLKKFLKK